MQDLLHSVVVGIITGAFSGGAVYGILKTELRWMRRDIDDIRQHLFGGRHHGNQAN